MKQTKRDSFLLPVNFEMKKRIGMLIVAGFLFILENMFYAHFFGWLPAEENLFKQLFVLLIMIVLDVYLVSAVKHLWNRFFKYHMKRMN